jgi:hypothetical protein
MQDVAEFLRKRLGDQPDLALQQDHRAQLDGGLGRSQGIAEMGQPLRVECGKDQDDVHIGAGPEPAFRPAAVQHHRDQLLAQGCPRRGPQLAQRGGDVGGQVHQRKIALGIGRSLRAARLVHGLILPEAAALRCAVDSEVNIGDRSDEVEKNVSPAYSAGSPWNS